MQIRVSGAGVDPQVLADLKAGAVSSVGSFDAGEVAGFDVQMKVSSAGAGASKLFQAEYTMTRHLYSEAASGGYKETVYGDSADEILKNFSEQRPLVFREAFHGMYAAAMFGVQNRTSGNAALPGIGIEFGYGYQILNRTDLEVSGRYLSAGQGPSLACFLLNLRQFLRPQRTGIVFGTSLGSGYERSINETAFIVSPFFGYRPFRTSEIGVTGILASTRTVSDQFGNGIHLYFRAGF